MNNTKSTTYILANKSNFGLYFFNQKVAAWFRVGWSAT